MNTQKPVILLITADELRKDALSCYGNEAIKTPNLDELADEAIVFDKAYTVSPWCLPARCSILTGLFPHSSGAYSNFRKCELNTGIPNLFTELQKGGYKTSLVGKCHFAPVPYKQTKRDRTLPYDEFRDYYVSLGIDYLALQDDKQVSVWFYDDYSKELDAAGYLKPYRDATWNRSYKKVFPFPAPKEWHPDSWVGEKAAKWIEEYQDDKPFCMWVSFSGPHYPFDAPEEYYNLVDTTKIKKSVLLEGEFDAPSRIHHSSYHGRGGIDGCGMADGNACKNYSDEYWLRLKRSYYANVAQIDEQIGKILNAARKRFGDNVLVIFTADHGEMLGNHGLWGKNNCVYEDVWNIPMIVKYPNEQKGMRTDAKVMLTDVMATCMKAAGMAEMETDGIDFKENMESGGYHYVYAEGEGYAAISDGTLKYVHVVQDGKEYYEFFDLSKDPEEFYNVIDQPEYTKKLSKMRKAFINLFMKKLLP